MSAASIYQAANSGVPIVNAESNIQRERFDVSILGQTLFTLTLFEYTPNTNTLFVFINGVIQTNGLDYVETSTTSFTLNVGINIGDTVLAVAFGINGTANPVANTAFVTVTDFANPQAAHTATDGFVNYPIGQYDLSTGLSITNPASGIIGQGNGQDFQTYGTALTSSSVVNNLVTVTGADGFTIRDLSIHGAYTAGNPALCTPILLRMTGGTYGTTIENMQLNGGAIAIYVDDSFYTRMRNITTKNFSGDAVFLSSRSASSSGRSDNTEMIQCAWSPGSSNITTDCWRHEGTGGSHKFVECVCVFGRRGIYIMPIALQDFEPGFFYFVGGGMENCELENIRAETGNHFQIAGASYFSQDGDANNFWFGTDVNNVQIGPAYLRGAGRSGIYFNGGNLSLAGTSIYNCGRYSAPSRGYHTPVLISGPTGPGGIINITANPVNNGTTIRQQPFETGDWVVIENDTTVPSCINGAWKITVIAGNTFTLNGAVYGLAPTGAWTIRVLSACVHIGPDADKVNISACQLGYAIDGTTNHDYCLLIESPNEVKWALDCLYTPGTLGTIKYTPDVPPENCHYWEDRKSFIKFTSAGALVAGYLPLEYLPKGLYALTAISMITTVGGASIAAVCQDSALAYRSTGLVVATTTFTEYVFAIPLLVRIGADVQGTDLKVGIKVVTAAGDANLTAILTIIRLF